MTSFRIKNSWTIYLLVLICSLCLITPASSSLWGKKLQFKGMPCLWQLRPEAVVPALEELSVCILLRRNVATKWTGFVYKAPGDRQVELGVGGSGEQLTVWLFGKEMNFHKKMIPNEWQSICITWSGGAQRLKVYVNGISLEETHLHHTSPKKLAQHGTLSLGVSHFSVDGEMEREHGTDLLGEIGLFRMWSREWSDEDLQRFRCADGDVVSWTKDLRQGLHVCPPQPDSNIQCEWSFYKINMKTLMFHSTSLAKCSDKLEGITRDWLEAIFPPDIFLQNVSVSYPSHTCHMGNDSVLDPLHIPQPQAMDEVLKPSCDKCFSCEVRVNMNPAVSVEVVQAKIAALLRVTYSSGFINLTADPKTISILPVALLVNDLPSFIRSTVATSESGPTLSSLTTILSNVSTTGEPLDFNETIYGPDTFLRVNLTLNMTSSIQNPKTLIRQWIKDQLEANGSMTVINMNIKDIAGRNGEHHTGLTTFQSQPKLYFSTFHVQEFEKNTVPEVVDIVQRLLTVTHVNSSIAIQTVKLEVKHIVPPSCEEDPLSTIYGEYIWPETFPQVKQEMGCLKPKVKRAFRLCKLNIDTDSTSWDEPDMRKCTPLITISDLSNITVTPDNVAKVVDMIQDLVDEQLENSEELSPTDLQSVVEKLGEVVDLSPKEDVGANIVYIIDNILLSNTDVTSLSEDILNLTDNMGNNMDFQSEAAGLTASLLAFSMVNAEQEDFGGLTFGVSSDPSSMKPKIFLNQSFVSDPLPETVATISMPSGLKQFFQPGVRNKTRIQFHFYRNAELFQDQSIEKQSETIINSFIVSASINNSHVFNLSSEERVVVTFSHQQLKQPEDTVRCMFWDFQKNDERGGWNSRGCVTKSLSPLQSSCLCNHLTHFGLLLDVSRTSVGETDRKILTVISYLGCGISSLFLGITLLTYLLFEKLRRDYPSKILINLSTALLGLSMLFLLDSWLASFSNYDLCIATAATLHYFLLASFTWMGLEAVHMYLALVKVFNTYIPSYILKFCAVGWGVPLLIVSLVLAIDKDAYGSVVPDHAAAVLDSSDPFCWIQNDVFFYVTVVAFVLLVLIGNISVFIVVLIQIRRTRANKPSENSRSALHDLRPVASLTVLLGLTWSMGLFSFGPARIVLLYLFAFSSTFQGFFVFLFHCLMKENVRKQWRIHLCCGRFRLNPYSDWSRSMTASAGSKKNHLINSVASDSSAIARTSSSSTPSEHQHGA